MLKHKRVFNNTIHVDHLLKSGQEGEVYRCVDRRRDVVCALKTKSRGSQFDQRPLREVESLQALHSPHVTALNAVWVDPWDSQLHLLLEFCNTGDLEDYIQSQGGAPMPEEELRDLLAQMLLGLAHIHTHCIVHRDVKLGNILLHNPTGTNAVHHGQASDKTQGRLVVKFADFGCSKRMESPTALSYRAHGTPAYFSPEMIRGQAYDLGTDVWSLGVCVYAMMSGGVLPFTGKNEDELREAIGGNAPPALPTEGLRYPQEMVDIVTSMLTKRAADRPSAIALLRRFDILHTALRKPSWAPLSAQERFDGPCVVLAMTDQTAVVRIRSRPCRDAPTLGLVRYGDVVYAHSAVMESDEKGLASSSSWHRTLWCRLLHPQAGYCVLGYGDQPLFCDIRDFKYSPLCPPVEGSQPQTISGNDCTVSVEGIHSELKALPGATGLAVWGACGGDEENT